MSWVGDQVLQSTCPPAPSGRMSSKKKAAKKAAAAEEKVAQEAKPAAPEAPLADQSPSRFAMTALRALTPSRSGQERGGDKEGCR